MTPYYEDEFTTIYCGNCMDVPVVWSLGTMVTDPPYGIEYESGAMRKEGNARSIEGDEDTTLRDAALDLWDGPALVFGSWKRPIPAGTRQVLIWDTKGALGMGDLSLPWKPSHAQIYVLGSGFQGRRTTDVLTYAPVQARGRLHPHQKPLDLMRDLISKCHRPGIIFDPFMGSGSTLCAAKNLGRRAIGIEKDEGYCEIAAKRLQGLRPSLSPDQEALAL